MAPHARLAWHLVPLALFLTLSCPTTEAQSAVLVKDTVTTTFTVNSSKPEWIAAAGSDVYFAASTYARGTELYRIPLGATKPVLLKDISPGNTSSHPEHITPLAKTLFFSAFHKQLWKSDGTTAGTVFVKELDHTITNIMAAGNRVYMTTMSDSGTLYALWVSDGTTAGTIRIAPPAAYVGLLAPAGGRLLFSFVLPGSNCQLWVTDGTTAGTGPLTSALCSPYGAAVFGSKAMIVANQGSGQALWISDGTAKGTVALKSFHYCNGGITLGNTYYFTAASSSTSHALWKTDGTSSGTVKIKDTPVSVPGQSVISGNSLFFFCYAKAGGGMEIWKSDGTARGTAFVHRTLNLRGGPELINPVGYGMALFLVWNSATGKELWVTDGSSSGTHMLKDINPGPKGSDPAGMTQTVTGHSVFAADDGKNGRELWITDGTVNGTKMLADIQPPYAWNIGGNPSALTDHAGITMFSTGMGGWVTDGSTNGTVVVSVAYPGRSVSLGGDIFFPASRILMKTNGKVAGTSALPAQFFNPPSLAKMGGHLYFNGSSPSFDGLWRTDGTRSPPTLVKSIGYYMRLQSGSLANFFVWNDLLFFTGFDQKGFWLPGLFRSDGTANGTIAITALPSSATSDVCEYAVAGNRLFFLKHDSLGNMALFSTDGTVTGTVLLANASSMLIGGRKLGVLGNILYFQGSNSQSGVELWRTDGTNAGTYMFKDINPGSSSSNPMPLVAVGTYLFLLADDGTNGMELWKTDGTAKATVLVTNIGPGSRGMVSSGSYDKKNAIAVGKWLYFSANDGINGDELWRSDGTGVGTTMVDDIFKGPSSSHPHEFTLSGGNLLFNADDGKHGAELFKIDPAAHAQRVGSGCATSVIPTLAATPPKIGSTLAIDVNNAIAAKGVRGVLLLGVAVSRPTYLGNGCSIYIDLTAPYLSIPFVPDTTGHWSLRTLLPTVAILHGLLLPVQAGTGPTANGPLGTDMTSGLFLAVRR